MIDDINFNFSKATGLVRRINESKDSLNKIADRISAEINNSGRWWGGESYEAYKGGFTSIEKGRPAILGVAGNTTYVSNYLTVAAEAKMDWETKGKQYFT